MVELIGYEIQKTMKLRYVFWAFTGLLILTGLLFAAEVCSPEIGTAFSPSAYCALVSDIDTEDLPGEAKRLQEVVDAILFEQKEPAHLYTGNLRSDWLLYEQVTAELEQVSGYQMYLEKIRQTYENQNQISLFQTGKAEQAEQEKAAADFARMEGTQTAFVGTYGACLLMKTDFWTVSLVMLAFILTAGLLLNETEGHGIRLLRCTAKGKRAVVYAKYFAGIGLLAVYLLLSFLGRLAVIAASYGCGGWSVSIQSVYGSESCTMRISVWQAMALFAAYKLLAVVLLYSLFCLVALLLRRSSALYLLGLGSVLVGYAAYRYIGANSWLSGWKWLNPTAFLYTDSLLMEYRNLTFFGHPFTYRYLMLAVGFLTVGICLLIFGRLFSGIKPAEGLALPGKGYVLLEKAVARISGRNSLTGFEGRKWGFYQGGALVCILYIAGILLLSPTVPEQLYTKEEIYYKYYVKQIEGPFSQEKLDKLYQEQDRLKELKEKMLEEADSGEVSSFYERELDKEEGLSAAIGYGEQLKEYGGSFVYGQGYEMLFGRKNGANYMLTYRIASLAVLLLLAGLVWQIEKSSGMKSVLRISAVGEKRINAAKYVNIVMIGTGIGLMTYLPWLANVSSVFGMQMVTQPACSLSLFYGLPPCLSIAHVLAIFYILHIAGLWLAGMILKRVEKITRNMLLAQMIVFAAGAVLAVV